MTRTGWVWTAVAVVVVVGGGLWFMNRPAATPATSPADTSGTAMTGTGGDQAAPAPDTTGSVTGSVNVGVSTGKTVTVSYNGSSFSPKSVTIAKGDTVNFVTSGRMWIASDPHPAHSAYDGTSRSEHCAAGYTGPKPLDECSGGASFSFTFDKSGTFGYHDHLNDEAHGTVVVQ